MKFRAAGALVGLLLALLAWSAAPDAWAAFPGQNGRIAFSAAFAYDCGDETCWGPSEIFTSKPDGTHTRQLTDNGSEDLEPTFSSDGKRIAFVSTRQGSYDIYAMHTDGTHQHPLTRDAKDEFDPAFAPNGRTIAFARGSLWGGFSKILLMRRDGSHQHVISHHQPASEPSFFPAGRKIVFLVQDKIWAMRTDGAHPHRVAQLPDFAPAAYPDVSPNGNRIAFNFNSDLEVMHADGSSLQRIGGSELNGSSPVFAPAGRRIGFLGPTLSPRLPSEYTLRQPEIYLIGANGSIPSSILPTPSPFSAFSYLGPLDWGPKP